MEQKETVRQVGTEKPALGRIGQNIQDIIERFVHGRRTPLVREVLQTKTPDAIVRMFERHDEDDCKHLKGQSGSPSPKKDYAIMVHTFPDGRCEVKCMICGKKWERIDLEAIMMMKNTTNTPSSSEVPLDWKPRVVKKEESLEISHLGRIMSHVMRYANFFYRLQEAKELDELQAQGPLSMRVLHARIQKYKDGLKKLGEENDSHR